MLSGKGAVRVPMRRWVENYLGGLGSLAVAAVGLLAVHGLTTPDGRGSLVVILGFTLVWTVLWAMGVVVLTLRRGERDADG